MKDLYKKDSGSYLIWTLPIIILLSYLASTVYYNSKGALLSSEVQSTADTAALSSSSIYCSSNDCFEEAWDSAFFTINNNLRHTISNNSVLDFRNQYDNYLSGNETKYSIGTRTDTDGNLYHFSSWDYLDSHGVKVEINRAVRWPDGKFESLEGAWQENNITIPRYTIANATEVIINSVNELGVFSSIIPNQAYKNEASSRSYKNSYIEASAVAPFAIHICSLLNNKYDQSNNIIGADFQDKEEICKEDRIFTNSNRYCPDGDLDCGIMPNFFWEPLSDDYNYANNNFYIGDKDVKDNFGVIGLPRSFFSTSDLTDAELALQNTDSIQSRMEAVFKSSLDRYALGENISVPISSDDSNDFVIFKNGLTNSSIEDVLLDIILARTNNTDNNIAYNQTDLAGYQFNYSPTKIFILPSMQTSVGVDATRYGSCNSRRTYIPGERWSSMNSFVMDSSNQYYIDFANKIVENHPSDPALDPLTDGNDFINQAQNSCLIAGNLLSEYNHYYLMQGFPAYIIMYNYYKESHINKVEKYLTSELRNSAVGFSGENDALAAPVWQIRVPVIAEKGSNLSSPCSGEKKQDDSLADNDPNFDITKRYNVIGYIKTNIFDLDIGYLPPAVPHIKNTPVDSNACNWATENCSLCAYGNNTANIGINSSSYARGPFTSPIGSDTDSYMSIIPGTYPYGFTKNPKSLDWVNRAPYFPINHNPEPCNLIRARVACNAEIEIGELASQNAPTGKRILLIE